MPCARPWSTQLKRRSSNFWNRAAARATQVGAPPMAILYSGEEAKRSRAMQNLFFLWGMLWSLGSLTALGLVEGSDLLLALALAPSAGVALIVSRPVAKLMDGRSIKPFALTASGLGALTLLWRAWA